MILPNSYYDHKKTMIDIQICYRVLSPGYYDQVYVIEIIKYLRCDEKWKLLYVCLNPILINNKDKPLDPFSPLQ